MPPAPLSAVWPEAPRLVPDAPLPRYRFVGGLHPHPRTDPAGSLYGLPAPAPGLPAARWRDDRTYLLGIDLYHQGFLWEAHEQWEAGFFAARGTEDGSAASPSSAHRDLLQALIQIAAALIQAHRRRGAGVRTLVAAVVRRLRSVCGTLTDGASADGLDGNRASAEGGRIAGLDPRALLTDVERHFAPALDAATSDDGAARTVGLPPRLEVRPWP